jgi:Barstar (barnase inhibitor)
MSSDPDLTQPARTPEGTIHEVENPPDPAVLEAAGIRLAEIDGLAIESKQDLMSALTGALELPGYFGRNWDALDEVLRDLGWLEADGHVLILRGASELRSRAPELVAGLVRSWTFSAPTWIEKRVPFHLVLTS